MFKFKWLRLLGILIICFMVTGCSTNNSNQQDNEPNQGTQVEEKKPDTKLESDKDLAKQLEAEKGIESVMVQVVEGEQRAVNVDIVVNNEQELTADQVIEKYSTVIKEKYPDRTIDIIIVKEGKLIKQTTLK
ncbi:hypothetical protein [Desulfosporosinus meridiei]|uniref:Uncharacterized protein n=1 Tax=Desulfosporosinus meridiei (strain ATCC BAA-275 / DSM 13257 / KCTC 12902 / NCIMB 13706 / S10) TaxID=768704 RepID=J7J591_DESMD|nr:hypothetical protein [Desulfosporosinus meridiei]AFQ46116.1 hypothetical protein Desmer_4296 [Desulfosporosinus meridiei DSM 13257]